MLSWSIQFRYGTVYGFQINMTMVLSIRPHIRRLLYTTSTIAHDEPRVLLSLDQNKDHLPQKINNVTQVNMLEVNSKLKELVKTGFLKDARQMFDKLPHRDVVSWTTMISGYVSASDSSQALSLFSKMWAQPNFGLDPFVLSVALKACGLGLNAKHGELLHGYCVKTGFVNSVFVGSALLDMYTKNGRIWDGCRVFDEMPLRNVVSWTAIITGLVHAGYNNEGLRYFSEMWRVGEDYDSYTFAIALKACADKGALNYGREIHTQAMKKGYDMGQEDHAVRAFLRMRESEVCPNEYTFAAVISACANLARMEWGEQLHAHVLVVGLLDALSVANSIMTMYSRCGHLNSASMVFHEMMRRDIVSWSTIIAGYAQGGYGEEAFNFLVMDEKGGTQTH
ncbi:hypothetical protein HYC85_005525 [Camellia sinensis]|uniref:Pentatricopeptide repeat-containing protein n=1 Tax=Camellia sinensis TaxID=4442 RepID=A0A7J7HZR3_CAMSI|nr:hypothetical protein HYC85_005525 [Camellia sinensis]